MWQPSRLSIEDRLVGGCADVSGGTAADRDQVARLARGRVVANSYDRNRLSIPSVPEQAAGRHLRKHPRAHARHIALSSGRGLVSRRSVGIGAGENVGSRHDPEGEKREGNYAEDSGDDTRLLIDVNDPELVENPQDHRDDRRGGEPQPSRETG